MATRQRSDAEATKPAQSATLTTDLASAFGEHTDILPTTGLEAVLRIRVRRKYLTNSPSRLLRKKTSESQSLTSSPCLSFPLAPSQLVLFALDGIRLVYLIFHSEGNTFFMEGSSGERRERVSKTTGKRDIHRVSTMIHRRAANRTGRPGIGCQESGHATIQSSSLPFRYRPTWRRISFLASVVLCCLYGLGFKP